MTIAWAKASYTHRSHIYIYIYGLYLPTFRWFLWDQCRYIIPTPLTIPNPETWGACNLGMSSPKGWGWYIYESYRSGPWDRFMAWSMSWPQSSSTMQRCTAKNTFWTRRDRSMAGDTQPCACAAPPPMSRNATKGPAVLDEDVNQDQSFFFGDSKSSFIVPFLTRLVVIFVWLIHKSIRDPNFSTLRRDIRKFKKILLVEMHWWHARHIIFVGQLKRGRVLFRVTLLWIHETSKHVGIQRYGHWMLSAKIGSFETESFFFELRTHRFLHFRCYNPYGCFQK